MGSNPISSVTKSHPTGGFFYGEARCDENPGSIRSRRRRTMAALAATPKGRDERSERVNPISSVTKSHPTGGFFYGEARCDENPGSIRSRRRRTMAALAATPKGRDERSERVNPIFSVFKLYPMLDSVPISISRETNETEIPSKFLSCL